MPRRRMINILDGHFSPTNPIHYQLERVKYYDMYNFVNGPKSLGRGEKPGRKRRRIQNNRVVYGIDDYSTIIYKKRR